MTQWSFPASFTMIERDEDLLSGYARDALYHGQPAVLARPKSEAEVQELLAYCNQHGIPVTACGNQTSMTGASVSEGGLLLSTELLSKDWRIFEDPAKPGRWLVDAGPALLLADFQDALSARGYFYPPDPTSRGEVLLGSTVATNASGEDSYKYGSTRRWVRGMTFIRADGVRIRTDRPTFNEANAAKNTCGYPIRDTLVDQIVGSEGTLGVITALTLEVLPEVPQYFSILYFLPDEACALAEVCRLDADPAFDLRCIEYLDRAALDILAVKAKGLAVPDQAGAALYIKQEFYGDEDEKTALWADHLEVLYREFNMPELSDSVCFGADPATQAQMRQWRHLVPATVNERAWGFKSRGGGKVSTDWYVPLTALAEMFSSVRRDQGDMEWVVFGHIGNGHPHFNFIAHDQAQYLRARALLEAHCRRAVAAGGGVSGEHGLGKLKTHLLAYQYESQEIQAMLAIKRELDPKGILAPGNIFSQAVRDRFTTSGQD